MNPQGPLHLVSHYTTHGMLLHRSDGNRRFGGDGLMSKVHTGTATGASARPYR